MKFINIRKFFLVCVIFLCSFMTLAEKNNVDQTNPYQLIKTVAQITFERINNEQENIYKNPNLLKDIVREELMPYVNYQYSAFKVMGTNYRKTSKAERSEFVPAFRDYLISTYAQVFTLYNNQKVEFAAEKNFEKKKIVSVDTRINELGKPTINISFRVRKNKKNNQWKAYDMVAEGVSLLDSKRVELNNIIRQNGLPYVTKLLIEKSKKDIVFKS